MTQTTPTCLWNDSAAIEELTYSIQHGAVGATCNPSIAVSVLKQEMPVWKGRILELAESFPEATEDEIAWMIVEEMSVKAAKLLKPIFDREKGRNGRLSIQTDPRNYRNSGAMLTQAIRFSRLAPNMIVKIAATRAGIIAIEEATYRGISINATVSFTLPQALANRSTPLVEATATVINTGDRSATEVVQCYVRNLGASIEQPVRSLKGFERVTLAPGESKQVSFPLGFNELSFFNLESSPTIEATRYTVWIGGSSLASQEAAFEVLSPARKADFH